MLYWHFRNIQFTVMAFFKPKLSSPTEKVVKRLWANPFDSEWLRVMQAGRYFTYTDTGRMELAVRTGLFKLLIKNRWVLIVGGQKIIYRRSVKIFKSFDLSMQLVGWDEKWMYIEHTFVQDGELCCVLHSKVGMRSKGKLVSPHEAFKATGQGHLISPRVESTTSIFARDSEVLSLKKPM